MANAKEIDKFINNFQNNLSAKYTIFRVNNTIKVNLEYKMGESSLLVSQLAFDSMLDAGKKIGYLIADYDMVQQYIFNGETLHIEKVRDEFDNIFKEILSFGEGSVRFFPNYSLELLNNAIYNVHHHPIEKLNYSFMSVDGNNIKLTKKQGEYFPYKIRYCTKNNNLVGYTNTYDLEGALDCINWSCGQRFLKERQFDDIDYTINSGKTFEVVRHNGELRGKIEVEKVK